MAAALALAGCVGNNAYGPAQVPSGLPGTVVPVTIDSFFITAPSSVKAGKVTFYVSNTALDVRHEFNVAQPGVPADQLQMDGDSVVEKKANILDHLEPFKAGTAETLTMDLKPGKYVFFCNIPGHYLYGMRFAFTVTP